MSLPWPRGSRSPECKISRDANEFMELVLQNRAESKMKYKCIVVFQCIFFLIAWLVIANNLNILLDLFKVSIWQEIVYFFVFFCFENLNVHKDPLIAHTHNTTYTLQTMHGNRPVLGFSLSRYHN